MWSRKDGSHETITLLFYARIPVDVGEKLRTARATRLRSPKRTEAVKRRTSDGVGGF